MHVVLVGSMAVGKSTVGRGLAARVGRPFHDSDDDLAATRGVTGRALAEREGVDALHTWEAEHLLATLAATQPVVVAAAASVVDDAACLAALREPFVIWLRAPAAVLARRLARGARADDHRRPVGDATAIAELEVRRAGRFGRVADLTIDTVVDGVTTRPEAIVAAILPALGPAPPGHR
ncbi:MAG: shikimate kinase [Acidimicrobiales bacterium]